MRAEKAIARARRDLLVSTILKSALIGGAALAVVSSASVNIDGTLVLAAVGIAWFVLSYRSVRGSRMAAGSPLLIASGDYEQAEMQIEAALRSFSLFRTVKLLSLHHLAVLRHAQQRWHEAAMLSRAVLGQRLGPLRELSRPSQLILAEALLELGDLQGTYAALCRLYQERLTLAEALTLLGIELDYLARLGDWERMLQGTRQKVQLAELMPTAASAQAQGLLALAAVRSGRAELARWLRRRAELLAEPSELCRRRPALAALWSA